MNGANKKARQVSYRASALAVEPFVKAQQGEKYS